MKNTFSLLFCILISQSNKAQDITYLPLENCNLRIANDLWLKEYDNALTIDEKLILVKKKISSDTVYVFNNDPELYCDYKARHILFYQNNEKVQCELTNSKECKVLIDNLKAEDVSEIQISQIPRWKRAFYCTDPTPVPREIFILIKTNNKVLKKEIKKYRRLTLALTLP